MNRNLCSVEVAEFVLQVNIFMQSKYDQTLIFVCFSQIVNVDMINGFERRPFLYQSVLTLASNRKSKPS